MTETRAGKTGANPLEALLGYQLRRAAAAMQADLAKRMADLELTIVEMSVLLVIETNPSITQSEIGRMLAIKRANMAPMAALLTARGLIDRTVMNGRSHGLVLTAKGRTLLSGAHDKIKQNEERLVARMPAADRTKLMELLRMIWETTD